MSAGKGDRQRPTDREKFSSGWDLAFGKKDKILNGKSPMEANVFDGVICSKKGEPDESKPINKGQDRLYQRRNIHDQART